MWCYISLGSFGKGWNIGVPKVVEEDMDGCCGLRERSGDK